MPFKKVKVIKWLKKKEVILNLTNHIETLKRRIS